MSKVVKINDRAYEMAKKAKEEGEGKSIYDIISRSVEVYLSEKMEHERAITYAKELVRYLENQARKK